MRKKVRGPRRFAFSDEQEDALVSQYGKDKFPSFEEREQLATQLQLTYKQVDLWFRNRRYRDPSKPAVGRNGSAAKDLDLQLDDLVELPEASELELSFTNTGIPLPSGMSMLSPSPMARFDPSPQPVTRSPKPTPKPIPKPVQPVAAPVATLATAPVAVAALVMPPQPSLSPLASVGLDMPPPVTTAQTPPVKKYCIMNGKECGTMPKHARFCPTCGEKQE